jgi:hypothetical protein
MGSKIENHYFLKNGSKIFDYTSVNYARFRIVTILSLDIQTGNVDIVETNFNSQTVFFVVGHSANKCGLTTTDFVSKENCRN